MGYTVSYKSSSCPKVDAINDIKQWLGQSKWDELYPYMAALPNQNVFALAASFAGVKGFPVIAWYELIHGEGSWKDEDENPFI